MHALSKETLLLKNIKVIFEKALEKLVVVSYMFLKRKIEEMHGSLNLMLYNTL